MGFGKVVRAAKATTPLIGLIRDKFKSEEPEPPLTSESFVRCSSLSSVCPREEVLRVIHEVVRAKVISVDLNLVFSVGKGLHGQLQNEILPLLGDVLFGQWKCLGCAKVWGGMQEGKPMLESLILKPKACLCGGTEFLYEELSLRSEQYRLTGHPDGFLKLPEYEGFGILEAKSISEKGAWEVKKTPKLDHVIQAQMYMWFTGTQWAQILYWDKGTYGLPGLIEHHIERDDEVLESILSSIDGMWGSIKAFKDTGAKVLPERICANATCPRAEVCSVAKQCFAEGA